MADTSMELTNLNEDRWREVFQTYDVNNDGRINIRELRDMIRSTAYEQGIPRHVIRAIHKSADVNMDGELDFQEFLYMVNNPDNELFFTKVQEKYSQYVKFLVPKRRRVLEETTVDGRYEDQYKCCPPPVIMILISLIEIILFGTDLALGNDSNEITGPVANALLYDPHQRKEFWRFLTYMFVHIGKYHLIVNILVQIVLGVPLEMVHNGLRVAVVYLAGVIAGSLGTSITDPTVRLAGASGGVYSLITAHLASIIMNWSEMTYPIIQLIIFIVLMGSDVGTAIYNRYVLNANESIGYAAHFFGALAGLLVGIFVLRNIEVTRPEKIIRAIAIVVFVVLMGSGIIINIFYQDYFPVQRL
ncbi:PREDICTED: rhomboid-related protein 2-like [Nicrophorus vespilloides]|uniref:Rhomboid-related protein 2-like n=1 Tax=Nicrophorus vespilloides TaxID=110193 RepID=A0ABM1N5C3_NICVS|nr:PREDICTED: rhomboid-related protein 2-like [Nicrophorus vespilloides]